MNKRFSPVITERDKLGRIITARANVPSIERFMHYIEISPSGCWEWSGGTNSEGYGNFSLKNQAVKAHRYSFGYFKGEIPKGFVVDHLCRNHKCVNPDHLEAVSNKTNIIRGVGLASQESKRTHCPFGHEYTEDNIYRTKNKYRNCKACAIRRSKERRLRIKQMSKVSK